MSAIKPWVGRRGWLSCAAGVLLCLSALPCAAAIPDWLRAAARASLPPQPRDVDAVVLLSEQNTTVQDDGEMRTVLRIAYRILRPDGRRFGNVHVNFDDDDGLAFSTGIGITITKLIADADTTAVAASDCVVNVHYK